MLKINEKGLDWPAFAGKDSKPLTLFDVIAAASKGEVPATTAASVTSTPTADDDDSVSAKNKETLQKRIDKLQEEVVSLTKQLRAAQAANREATKELERSVDQKDQEIKEIEDQRQRAEDEIARQKHRAATAVAEAKEKRDELEQLQAKKDKDVSEVEKERARLQNELQRYKRRADDAAEEKQVRFRASTSSRHRSLLLSPPPPVPQETETIIMACSVWSSNTLPSLPRWNSSAKRPRRVSPAWSSIPTSRRSTMKRLRRNSSLASTCSKITAPAPASHDLRPVRASSGYEVLLKSFTLTFVLCFRSSRRLRRCFQ